MITAWVPAAVAVSLYAAGCQVASADPGFDRVFTLGGGQEASVDGLRVRFADVLEDSRCPASVVCFWSGQARLTVVAQTEDASPTTVEFNTNPAPGQGVSSGRVGAYTVTMLSLEPYPQTPEDVTPLSEYRVTLSVAKG